jgi:MFS family permease
MNPPSAEPSGEPRPDTPAAPAGETLASDAHRSLPRSKPFQRFWCTRVLSSLSFQMLAVAMGWHIYGLTHSAFALGLLGLAQFLPMFTLTLVVGHVADRCDRRRIAAVCQSAEAVAALMFALGTFGGLLSAPVIYLRITHNFPERALVNWLGRC